MDSVPPEVFLAAYPTSMRGTAEALRRIVRRTVPDAIEAVRPGWRLIGYDVPNGRRTTYFGYIAPEEEHVHLGFEHGVLMNDPDGLLRGAGVTRQVRWLTFTSPDAIDRAAVEPLLLEAVRVARLGRSERFARLLDRTP